MMISNVVIIEQHINNENIFNIYFSSLFLPIHLTGNEKIVATALVKERSYSFLQLWPNQLKWHFNFKGCHFNPVWLFYQKIQLFGRNL